MLGKLIRYDGKIQLKFLCSLFIVSAVVSLFAGMMGWLHEAYPQIMVLSMFSTLALGFSILAIFAMVFANIVYVVLHFRKNLFRDEGYLMHTLPVTEPQLFFSKLITGSICVYLSIIAGCLCACIGTRRWDYLEVFMNLLGESGILEAKATVLVLLTFFLLVPFTLCQFYSALTIGYTWKVNSNSHINRDLLSIASYVILYMIQQIVGLIALMLYLVFTFGNPLRAGFLERMEMFMDNMNNNTGEAVVSYIQGVVGMALGINLVIAVVLVVIILRRLNYHLNLE